MRRVVQDMTAVAVRPLLVLGWGNASRGDDALGPWFVERLRERVGADDPRIDWLDDYQLQIEHALDLQGRERVLLVDASRSCSSPFEVTPVQARRDASFTTHALTPAALLQVVLDLKQGQGDPPPCTLLAIRGESFELGASPGVAALANLAQALDWGEAWLQARRGGVRG